MKRLNQFNSPAKNVMIIIVLIMQIFVADASAAEIIGISVPVNSCDALPSHALQDDVWSVGFNSLFTINLGVGYLVNPNWDASTHWDFTLHDHVFISPHIPDPGRAVVTYKFDRQVIVDKVEIIQHNNGITRIEGYVGSSLSSLTSIGSIFGTSGDLEGWMMLRDGQRDVFDFNHNTPGVYFKFIIRKTSFKDGWATYRAFPKVVPFSSLCSTDGHCYQRFDDTMSWSAAKADCESKGGYLVTITSDEEKKFVYDKLISDSPNNCWLGATDKTEEGIWHWVTDEDWVFDNWAYGEPDNCNDIEHYGVVDKQSGLWHDRAILNDGSCGCDCPDDFETMSTICEWGDIAGDLNGDNKVNGEDYQELRKSLGKCKRDSGFNSKADFDEDGCVSYIDYRIWYSEYYLD